MRCDCGYDFQLRRMEESYLSGPIQGQDAGLDRTRAVVGRILVVIGTVVCIVPYFVLLGLPVYGLGAFWLVKSNATKRNKTIVLAGSFVPLVLYYL